MARSARDLPPESSLARKAPNPGFGRGFFVAFSYNNPNYPKIGHKEAQNNSLSKIIQSSGEQSSFSSGIFRKSGKHCPSWHV